MSRTYRRKNVPLPSWWWRYEDNKEKANAWFHSDACFSWRMLTTWGKKQLRQEARVRQEEMLIKAICNGTEEELSIPKDHLIADRWSYDY